MEKIVTVIRIDKHAVVFNDYGGAHRNDVPKDVQVGDRFYVKTDDHTNKVERLVRIK